MKKIIILVISFILIGMIIAWSIYFNKTLQGNPPVVDGARTLYTGYVEIEPLTFAIIKERLEARNCNTYEVESKNLCRYRETSVPFDGENAIEVYPRGFGFGPMSIYLTENRLWANKDIFGPPDIEKFKGDVRKDVLDIDNVVSIIESSWEITDTKYPWTVIY